MNAWAIAIPILIPLTAAALCAAFWRSVPTQRAVSLLASALLLPASILLLWTVPTDGIVAAQMGGWRAPFGITLVADTFSAIMVAINALLGLTVAAYGVAYPATQPREQSGPPPHSPGRSFSAT